MTAALLHEEGAQGFLYYVPDLLSFFRCPNPRQAVKLGIERERSLLRLRVHRFSRPPLPRVTLYHKAHITDRRFSLFLCLNRQEHFPRIKRPLLVRLHPSAFPYLSTEEPVWGRLARQLFVGGGLGLGRQLGKAGVDTCEHCMTLGSGQTSDFHRS